MDSTDARTSVLGSPVVVYNRGEEEREGTPLLVLLHGIGAHERDLWPIVDLLPKEFTVASVRAPLSYGPGYSWFDLTFTETVKEYDSASVLDSLTWLADWLESVRAGYSSVSLLGFSQGMAMATGLLRMNPSGFAATVGLSGFVTDTGSTSEAGSSEDSSQDGDSVLKDVFKDVFKDSELAELKPPYFWGRDQADPVVLSEWVDSTNSWLQSHVTLTKVLYSGMGHGINAQEIGHVSEFLASTL